MRIRSLYVRNIRNLVSQELFFDDGVNEFIGKNAQGKTAFLEAIHALIIGKSFRTHLFSEIRTIGTTGSLIQAEIDVGGVCTQLRLECESTNRRVAINGLFQENISSLFGHLVGVTCSIDDLDLIYGAPAVRRAFVDQQIAQIDPYYVEQLRHYAKALRQRNYLLKKHQFSVIAPFELILARAAAYIVERRKATVLALQERVELFYHLLFAANDGEPTVLLQYSSQSGDEDVYAYLLKQYEANRLREAKMGATLYGPHRDDMVIFLQKNLLARQVGSSGQNRALALALRFAEWQLLHDRSKQKPLCLIDDVHSLFDSMRVQNIASLCERFGQIFTSSYQKVFFDKGTAFEVVSGKVV